MISKSDILLLLSDLEDAGEDVSEYEKQLLASNDIPVDILKYINSKKQLDVVKFYDKIRRSYNHKSSKLYKNIVKCDENVKTDAKTIVSTLSAFLNQCAQFEADDPVMFAKHARCEEITAVLYKYFTAFDLGPAYKLLKLIKADLVTSE